MNDVMTADGAPPAETSPLPPPVQGTHRSRAGSRAGGSGAVAPETTLPNITLGFGSLASFELGQRMARMLSNVEIIPDRYRARYQKGVGRKAEWVDNPNAVPNCFAALTMAERMKIDVLTVMQNLYVVHGQPAWSGAFAIGIINSCTDRFMHELQFEWTIGKAPITVAYNDVDWNNKDSNGRPGTIQRSVTVPDITLVAWTVSRATGKRVESQPISCRMAAEEGWWQGNPKWQSMTQQMMMYRAGSWFGRVHAPDRLLGLGVVEDYATTIDGDQAAGDQVQAPAQVEQDAASGAPQLTQEHRVTMDLEGTVEREAEKVTVSAGGDEEPADDDSSFDNLR